MQAPDPEDDDVWPYQIIDLSGKIPDLDRIYDALDAAISFEEYNGDGWDAGTQMLLWQRAQNVYEEEYGIYPPSEFPAGAFHAKVTWHEVKEELGT